MGIGRARMAFVHKQHDRNGKQRPPDPHHEKGYAHRLPGIGQTKDLGLEHHEHVQGEQQPAPQVAHGITQSGHPVQLVFFRNVHQQGVIGHDTSGETDDAQGVQQQSYGPHAGRNQKQGRCHQGAQKGKQQQVMFLAVALIRKSADQRREQHHQGAGGGVPHAQPEGAVRGGQATGPVLLEKYRKETRHHRGGKGRVAPVIQCPAHAYAPVHQLLIPTPRCSSHRARLPSTRMKPRMSNRATAGRISDTPRMP